MGVDHVEPRRDAAPPTVRHAETVMPTTDQLVAAIDAAHQRSETFGTFVRLAAATGRATTGFDRSRPGDPTYRRVRLPPARSRRTHEVQELTTRQAHRPTDVDGCHRGAMAGKCFVERRPTQAEPPRRPSDSHQFRRQLVGAPLGRRRTRDRLPRLRRASRQPYRDPHRHTLNPGHRRATAARHTRSRRTFGLRPRPRARTPDAHACVTGIAS